MLELKIFNDVTNVIIKSSEGTTQTRSVATTDLFALFAKQTKATDIVVPPGARQIIERDNKIAYLFITPGYCGNMPLVWFEGDIKTYGELSKYIPKKDVFECNDFRNESVRIFPIPFPATAVLVDFIKSNKPNELKFSKMWVWALKDTITPYDNQIAYRWPFTNVYTHHAVCLGSVPMSINNVDAAASYVRYLYNGLGNHDLDSNATYSKKDHGLGIITNPYQLVTKIIDAPSFPVDYLNPVGNLKSVVHTALFGN